MKYIWINDEGWVTVERYMRYKLDQGIATSDFPIPSVWTFSEYASPIDGKPITCRSQRREDLKRNGCAEWDPGVHTKGLRPDAEMVREAQFEDSRKKKNGDKL